MSDQSAWLIEHPHKPGRPRYWSEIDTGAGVGTWTSDPWKATRYETKEAAERVMRRWAVHPTVLEARAVSHGFVAEEPEPRLFVRFYAVGPRDDTGKLRRALDDLLVGNIDWPESIDWALSAEPADGWLISLLQDMREGNTKLLRPVEARVDTSVSVGSREGLELALRSEFDDEDALGAAQIVVSEGWRPPDEVGALWAAAERVVRAWLMSKVTPSNEITELERVLERVRRS